MKRPLMITTLAMVTAGFATVACAGQYEAGFQWNRSSDWTAGTLAGLGWAAGNPDTDAMGNRVWSTEWVQGGGDLLSASPWYKQPSQLMVWDASWFGDLPLWARGNDLSPSIGQSGLTHHMFINLHPYVPMVRWSSPFGAGAHVSVTGQLNIGWSGSGGIGTATDVDVVIAHVHANDNSVSVLQSATLANPAPGTIGAHVIVPVNLADIALGAGDQIVISHRSRGTVPSFDPSNWVNLSDVGLTIAVTGLPPDSCPADVDHSGAVDVDDLITVILAWGPCL